ncbi:MAG: hypothetical protein ACRD88_10935, partial [Terriglobia bacterium]
MQMRGARWFLLVAIAAIVGAVAVAYRIQRGETEAKAPPKPPPLPENIAGQAADWHWVHSVQGSPRVEIWAKNFKQEKDAAHIELQGVRLHLFHKNGVEYDRVHSAHAVFRDDRLFSDGEVAITLGVPAEGEPRRQLVSIRTSGVTFEKSGKASTDRSAEFVFENGSGRTGGASYDPATRELQLRGGVELDWRGRRLPMKLRAGEIIYKELDSQILLFPWARLERDRSVIDAADTVATLKDGAIDRIEAKTAKGADSDPRRRIEYHAERLTVDFADDGEVRSVTGESNARLVSHQPQSRTTMSTDRIDLE